MSTTTSGRKIWNGVYDSFREVQGDASVFDEDIWLHKVTKRASAALEASHVPAAIAPVAETRDYALPVVAALAARPGETLRILDFGGGLATSFIPLVKMLPDGQPLAFDIVENENLCARARDLMKNDARVRFMPELPPVDAHYDIAHCGSSLHYVDDWRELVGKLMRYRPDYLIFADLPAADNASFVTAQSFHGKRIPVNFWNLDRFIAAIAGLGYTLAFKSRYRSPVLDLDLNQAVSHFDEQHRLGYFVQLIFRPAIIPTLV